MHTDYEVLGSIAGSAMIFFSSANLFHYMDGLGFCYCSADAVPAAVPGSIFGRADRFQPSIVRN